MKGRLFKINIEAKLVLSFIISTTIPIIVLYLVSMHLVTLQLKELQSERLVNVYSNVNTYLEGLKETLHVDNIDYSHWSDMYEAVKINDKAWLKDVFSIQSTEKKVEMIYILDKDLNTVYKNSDIKGFDDGLSKYFDKAVNGEEFVTMADVGGQVYIVSFAQIIDYGFTNQNKGILIMGRRFDKELIRKLPVSYKYYVDFIYKGKGLTEEYIYYKDEDKQLFEKSILKSNGHARIYNINDIGGDAVVSLYIKDESSFIADTRESFRKGLFTAICITYVLLMLVLFYLKNNIMKPIRFLRDRVRQIRGSDAVQINKNSDELTSLTEEFEIMSSEISNRTNEINTKNEELERLVYYDDITNCYNKRFFRQHIKRVFDEAASMQGTLTIILIDIDNFRHYGEVAGKEQVENALRKISGIIRDIVDRETNGKGKVCFDGTDEFRIILKEMDYKSGLEAADTITKAIHESSFMYMERMPGGHINVSCGVANYPKDEVTLDKLLDAAQDRLIRIKTYNKGKIGYFYTIFNTIKNDLNEDEKAITYMSKAFLSVIDAMDEYTYTHTEGVVKYASILADELNLTETEKENIRIGALLHDIGKLELGREILNKKEKLTEEDISLIKQHPDFAINMLKPLQIFDDIIDIVRYHHEKFDGTGYPEGLKGEDIPFGARIIAVADSFDAMTTTRAYRTTHKTYEQALDELKKCSGTQFDPFVVEAFVNYIDRDGFNFLLI
ncbi:MAG: HD domain-containing phosphohydrolase [Bacillota bacterium]